MTAYYNDSDPFVAEWLRRLVRAGMIAPGDVDERSIEEVQPDDLRRYTQCHFFAGIGGWSRALRLAGWDDSRSVWSGSPPCQPFSIAGKGEADADARHLTPHWLRLIAECRPAVVVGEQVSAAIRIGWLDDLFVQLEAIDYACGAVDFPACSVGAPHRRQRCYFVGYTEQPGLERLGRHVDDRDEPRRQQTLAPRSVAEASAAVVLGDADRRRCEIERQQEHGAEPRAFGVQLDGSGTRGFWSRAEWIRCRDGVYRAAEPGTFPLADGVSARMGLLRAYGNAIAPPQAAEFLMACDGAMREVNA